MFKEKDLKEYLKENPYVLAPMVDHSDLPFRMLVRKHKVGLCFTPMLNAKLVVNDSKYAEKMFKTCEEDRPLVLQLAGHDPEIVLQAALKFIGKVDIIDLNLGCPQGIAKKGNYGAFLLENEKQVYEVVKKCVDNLPIPFSCKIRVFEDEEKTLKFVKKLEELGIGMLTVHGRTKKQNKQLVGETNWEIIKKIKSILKIPVIANGSIANFEDVENCLKKTNCDGVMSAEAILEYPALFDQNNGQLFDQDFLVKEYLECVQKYNDQIGFVKSHLFKMLFTAFKNYTDLRDKINQVNQFQDFQQIAQEIAD